MSKHEVPSEASAGLFEELPAVEEEQRMAERQDLGRLSLEIKARGSNAGRAAIDPRVRGVGELPRAQRLPLGQRGADGRSADGQRGGAGVRRGDQPLVEAGELVKDIRRPGGQAAQRRQAAGRTRERMASDAAKDVYKQRAATAECVNALARNRGLQRMGLDGRANASDHLPADRSASIKCFSGSEAP